jgi:hypothetical protein
MTRVSRLRLSNGAGAGFTSVKRSRLESHPTFAHSARNERPMLVSAAQEREMTEKQFKELKAKAIASTQALAKAWYEVDELLKAETDPVMKKRLRALQDKIVETSKLQ